MSDEGWSPDDDPLWSSIEGDIRDAFGEDAAITVNPASDHLDVRVLPRGVTEQIEAEAGDIEIVPYNALRMTVRRTEAAAEDGNEAEEAEGTAD